MTYQISHFQPWARFSTRALCTGICLVTTAIDKKTAMITELFTDILALCHKFTYHGEL